MNATRRTHATAPDRATSLTGARSDTGTWPMRQQILAIAENLYVLRGYDGFSFGHIAETAQTTRANIHHHFGDKLQLMAELIDGFSSNAQTRIAHHWIAVDGSFDQRLGAQLADLRNFYQRFNPQPGDRNVWSPLSRLRLDLQVLGPLAAAALHSVNLEYERCLRQAVNDAIDRRELMSDTPVQDVSRLLRVMLLSCAPMTQDSGDFGEVEQLFASMRRMIFSAWRRVDDQS
ncbi:MAG: TetR/AcrR family transcriptional regulator [Burkholderiaceae bacterium]